MNIRKIIWGISLILSMACSLSACIPEMPPTQTSATSELPVLKIGVDIIRPFFYTNENGNYTGVDAEIATEACRRAGYQPDFIENTWSDRDTYLKSKTVDCLWSAFIDGQEELYQWSDPYLQSNLRIIVGINSPDRDVATFAGQSGVAVRADSKIEELLLENPLKRPSIYIYSCGTFEMAETAFVKGYVSALGGHELVLQEVIHNYPGQYRFLDGSILNANLGVAFRKDDTSEYCQKINAALNEMREDGTIREITQRYLSSFSADGEVLSK